MREVAGFNFNCIPTSQLFPEQNRNLEKIRWRGKKLIVKPETEMSLKFKQSAFQSAGTFYNPCTFDQENYMVSYSVFYLSEETQSK